MIRSIQKIEHVQEDGTNVLLLDYGDFIEEEIEVGAEQQATSFSPIGAEWGIGVPDGGARRSFSFSRRKEHGSLTASQSWCYVHPSLMPFNKEGVIRVSIREAPDAPVEVWQMDSAVIQGCSARRFFTPRQSFFSLTTYQVTAGRMTPIGGDFGQCFPINWQTYVISDDLSIIGDDVCDSFPPYVPPAPTPGTPGELMPEDGPEYPWPDTIQITGTDLDVDNASLNAILTDPLTRVSNDSNGLPRWSSDGVWNTTGGPRIMVGAIKAGPPTDWYIIGVDFTSSNLNESSIADSPELGTFVDFSIFTAGGSGVPSIIIP